MTEAFRLRSISPPAELDLELTTLLSAGERAVAASYDLFAISPRPEPGSAPYRRAQQRANGAEREIARAAALLPLGIACRLG